MQIDTNLVYHGARYHSLTCSVQPGGRGGGPNCTNGGADISESLRITEFSANNV